MAERRHKYGNRPVAGDDGQAAYDSVLERDVGRALDVLVQQGRIRPYARQWSYVLAPAGRAGRAVCYVADFVIRGFGRWDGDLVLEARGYEPQSSRIKRRWFMDKYPHIPLRVVHAPEEVIGVIEALEAEAPR